MFRVALPLLLTAACSFGGPPPAPPTATTSGDAPTLEAACRREAERAVLYRDRGQQMRIDEGENRTGTQSSIPTLRAQTDVLGQSFERDRLARECVQASRATGAAPVAPSNPAPPARRAR
jgi:hypothetical protein